MCIIRSIGRPNGGCIDGIYSRDSYQHFTDVSGAIVRLRVEQIKGFKWYVKSG